MPRLVCLCLWALAAFSQTAPPPLGVVRDLDGCMRRVYGVSGSFVLGPAGRAVDAVAFSGRVGIAKSGTQIFILDGLGEVTRELEFTDIATSAVQIGFDPAGLIAVIWFENSGSVWLSNGDTATLREHVVTISLTANREIQAVIERGDALWTVTLGPNSGAVLAEVPRLDLLPSGQIMGDGWRLITREDGSQWAVRAENGKPTAYRLPSGEARP